MYAWPPSVIYLRHTGTVLLKAPKIDTVYIFAVHQMTSDEDGLLMRLLQME